MIILPLLLLGFSACGSSRHAAAPVVPDTITIRNFAFSPGTVTVSPGATITVQNDDESTHTVTATNKAFDTGNIAGGGRRTFTAPAKPGRYPYICEIHQYMTGTLVVS